MFAYLHRKVSRRVHQANGKEDETRVVGLQRSERGEGSEARGAHEANRGESNLRGNGGVVAATVSCPESEGQKAQKARRDVLS